MPNETSSNLKYRSVGKVSDWTNQLETIIHWLETKKINANVSRYSRYKEYITQFSTLSIERNKIIVPAELDALYKDANNALREIVQINLVYNAFKHEENKNFEERLKKIVIGKDFYEGEPQDQGRDFLYELAIAALYKNNGYEIEFESDTNTDVIAKKDHTLYIECKRLKSINNYEKNYEKACKQLKGIENASKSDAKLVYIDVYNCISEKISPYVYSGIIELNNEIRRVMCNEFEMPCIKKTTKLLKAYKDYVDGIVFTSMGVYAICFFNSIEMELYCMQDLHVHEDISNEKYAIVFDSLNGGI